MSNEKNTNDKVCYVVECSGGYYEDHHTWIAGIFPNVLDAEKLKNEIINDVELIKNIPCPINGENLEILSEQQKDEYYKWWTKNNKALDFNSAEVTQYPFGKPCM